MHIIITLKDESWPTSPLNLNVSRNVGVLPHLTPPLLSNRFDPPLYLGFPSTENTKFSHSLYHKFEHLKKYVQLACQTLWFFYK